MKPLKPLKPLNASWHQVRERVRAASVPTSNAVQEVMAPTWCVVREKVLYWALYWVLYWALYWVLYWVLYWARSWMVCA